MRAGVIVLLPRRNPVDAWNVDENRTAQAQQVAGRPGESVRLSGQDGYGYESAAGNGKGG